MDNSNFDFGGKLNDAGVLIEIGDDGIEITTPIRDSSGTEIAEIKRNHWTVFEGVQDKNYTDDTLEIKDKSGHVILQMRILPDRIQLQGVWRDKFNRGVELVPCRDPKGNIDGCIIFWDNPEQERRTIKLIDPIFRYPSKDYWGEFLGDNELALR